VRIPPVVSVLVPIALAATVLMLGVGPAPAQESPHALLEVWQTALDERDYAAYTACLSSATRAVPIYGSQEAMAFWAHEIEQLRARGFTGGFAIDPVEEISARWPAGSFRARPIIGGEPLPDAIVLIREAGHWKILRIFS
jgi:hypothetical protein